MTLSSEEPSKKPQDSQQRLSRYLWTACNTFRSCQQNGDKEPRLTEKLASD